MEPAPPSAASRALSSDTVVFSHTKAPSRQSGVVAGTASPVGPASFAAVATLARQDGAPQLKKFRVEAPRGDGARRMTVRVVKHGDKLGFGVRHDRCKRLQVSTLQGGSSSLQVGDTLLAVNGVDLTGQEFLTVIQQLKATRPGELVFEIERVEPRGANNQQPGQVAPVQQLDTPSQAVSSGGATMAASHATPVNPWGAASVAAANAGPVPPSSPYWQHNGVSSAGKPGRIIGGTAPMAAIPQTGIPPASIPVMNGGSTSGSQQPRKRARP
ncbi:unnamed protein product [Phytophthora lilii]|uniref:Unnamed protein product n=1 Tax=Phytophthora lilii TaxID=2077276 RepID=A0A9W6WQX3_9STRA|nr:unnamed protein product [Phytophthora lilii]